MNGLGDWAEPDEWAGAREEFFFCKFCGYPAYSNDFCGSVHSAKIITSEAEGRASFR